MNINATILGQIISFVFFIWFCMKYVWYPLMSIIENRQKEISDSFSSIEHMKLESERMRAEALVCLKESRIKAQEIIQQANEYKLKILDDIQCESEKERNNILLETQLQIAREKQLIFDELRKKIGQLIINSTEKIVERSINEIIDHDVIDRVINLLQYEE